MKFVGYQERVIILVSDKPIVSKDYAILEIPKELQDRSATDLLLNFQVKNHQLVSKTMMPPKEKIKLAAVSNWKMNCGLATYAEALLEQLLPQVGDFKLFIEQVEYTGTLTQAGGLTFGPEKISGCWKRGQELNDLIKQIKKYDPDLIWINHEWGLFPNARYWLSMMTQLSEYRIVATMHSTFQHADKTIVEASIPEMIVHLEGAKKVLEEEKQVPGKVSVIPHGCHPLVPGKFWNLYRTPYTFVQFGYGLPYKKFENSLQIVKLLKDKYPDVFFTGIFSETPTGKLIHQQYYLQLMRLIEELGIQNNVSLIRGHQSEASLDSYLRTNQVAVFPYGSQPGHEVWGATGAARIAMSKGLPIITSDARHFSDVESLKGTTVEEMAVWLDRLFSDSKFKNLQLSKQAKFIEDTSWKKIADQYLEVFSNPNI